MNCTECGFDFQWYEEEEAKVPEFYGLCLKCLEKKLEEAKWRGFRKIDTFL